MEKGKRPTLVVGVDGSAQSKRALEEAIALAQPLGAFIVAVFAVAPPIYYDYGGAMAGSVAPLDEFDPNWRYEIREEFESEWCAPLRDSGLPFKSEMLDGRAAEVLAEVADGEAADMVIVGRRGRGDISEMLLGSVSHELSHRCKRPVLLVPYEKPAVNVEKPTIKPFVAVS